MTKTRPHDVATASYLWIGAMALASIATIAGGFRIDITTDQREQLAQARKTAQSIAGPGPVLSDRWLVVGSSIITTVIAVGIGVLALIFYNMGHNWARIVLCAGGAVLVYRAVVAFAGHDPIVVVPMVLAGFAAIGAVITSFTKKADKYFRVGSSHDGEQGGRG